MAKADQIFPRMRLNPRDWRIEDLEALVARHGVEVRKPGGSHAVFFHVATGRQLSVPARRPIKPVYVQAFVEMPDQIGADDGQGAV